MSDEAVTNMGSQSNILLEVKNLKKYFPIVRGFLKRTKGHVRAVDEISFSINKGETLGLVGESGCGKTTTGRCILRVIEPTGGEILYHEENQTININSLTHQGLVHAWLNMQMIFQDPYSSLNPRKNLKEIIGEPLKARKICSGRVLEDRVADLLIKVGLRAEFMNRYPHAFSGGQRQRMGIARALALNPKFIVCDEPLSALDVSVQAQILNLLQDLQNEFDLTYLFISHNLGVVQHISNRVAVMYVGKIVEMAQTDELYMAPLHPYMEVLLSAMPKTNPRMRSERIILQGEIADPSNPPSGCYFHPRCRFAVSQCSENEPPLIEARKDHYVACHLAEKLSLRGIPTLPNGKS
jgi:peptide/nickel transport system ATP-binding protein